ncbi:hypothetical protein SAMN02799630_02240 [Paenibacillus sp. UNCCL117]|uniref:hypothetical protein n=1 Tax=unclassified Paenibacillus TaxID=185978 RepID=UPI0008840B08|nr:MULTISPECIES: hypothetical protein [unclassified Paenibacillus]SDD14846.1 hypothetical protein SAMN04488602_106116 [Paenibacillus sp. cl123]SFW34315.1 hypothetical protein SAMN02799630_02240 [Paenibacillus sp. UNCCL117]
MVMGLKRKMVQAGMAVMVLTMAAGSVGGAAAAENKTLMKDAEAVRTAAPAVLQVAATAAPDLLLNPVHERHYWKLLVGAYAPESAEAWNAALEERKQVQADLPSAGRSATIRLYKAEAAQGKSDAESLPAPLAVSAIPTAKADGLEQLDMVLETAPEGALSHRVQIRKLEDGKRIAEVDGKVIPLEESGAIMKTELPEEIKRQQQLTEAVEQGDGDKIRELLPQLLEDYRKQTEAIRGAAEKLKSQAETKSAAEAGQDK